MTAADSRAFSRRFLVEFIGIVGLVFLSFGLLYFLIPLTILVICAIIGVIGGILSLFPALAVKANRQSLLSVLGPLSVAFTVFVPFGFVLWFVYIDQGVISPTTALMVSALALVFYYYVFMFPLAFLEVREQRNPPLAEPPYPSVSIIVPAYNEAACIGASLDALRRIEYPGEWEIIVVDDGSTDETATIGREHAWSRVEILTKPNAGKHSALNYGVEQSTSDIVVTVDADSLLVEDSLARIAGIFQQNSSVDAVAGVLSVANTGSFITNLQQLEYVIGIQLFRRAYNLSGSVSLVPGALGAYRRSVIADIGGFSGDTLTEDFDATVEILKRGGEVRSVESICHTEAPETWRGLYRQRLRWDRGHAQTLLKHRDVFRTPQYGFLHAVIFPIVLLSLTLVPVAGMVILASIVVELLIGSPLRVLYFALFFTMIQSLVSVLAVRLSGSKLRLTLYAPLFVIGYRQFLDLIVLKSVVDVLRDRNLRWTRAERTGTLESHVKDDQTQKQPAKQRE